MVSPATLPPPAVRALLLSPYFYDGAVAGGVRPLVFGPRTLPPAGDRSEAEVMAAVAGDTGALSLAEALVAAARDISGSAAFAGGLIGQDRVDCVGLARKISLLVHLFEEIKGSAAAEAGQDASPEATSSSWGGASGPVSCLADLLVAIEVSRRFLRIGRLHDGGPHGSAAVAESLAMVEKTVTLQLQYVSWQLEKALGNLHYDYFDISDEVLEQVELVRTQLRRVTQRNGPHALDMFSDIYSTVYSANCKELAKINSPAPVDGDSQKLMVRVGEANNPKPPGDDPEQTSPRTSKDLKDSTLEDGHKVDSPVAGSSEECKKADPLVAPSDFLCPISLDLMRDPVVVSTGQTYERSSIQRWIDSGNLSCPKTQQRLQNLALTPNYVLRSLIIQWCEANSVEQRRRVRKSDGSYREVAGDSELIGELVRRLSGGSVVAQRAAAEEIRSLARRSTDNRILIAEAGAVPVLVGLLAAGDAATQEHAVTALLNLSICDSNKALIILSGAVGPIVQVLRTGSMEARENAAFALFSLSLDDENKVVIGSSPGVFEALVALLRDGSARGRRDAATALFNLCIYSGNKPRAVHAGVLAPVLWLFENPAADMVDEAVALLSVVVSHQEGKAAAARANVIPLLVEVLRAGQPQVKENAAAVLLTLCKKDAEGLGSLEGLGAVKLLAELAHSGTDRARRKAAGLLEQLKKLRRTS